MVIFSLSDSGFHFFSGDFYFSGGEFSLTMVILYLPVVIFRWWRPEMVVGGDWR